jgi:hypothetical protein
MRNNRSRRFRPSLDTLPLRLAPTGIIFDPMPATSIDQTLTEITPPPVIMPPAEIVTAPADFPLLATTLPERCI